MHGFPSARCQESETVVSRIHIGLIGFGAWTRSAYVPALRLDGRAQVTAVAAPSAATRDRAIAELGPEIAVFPSAPELLAATDMDAVTVAVPDLAHEPVLTDALASGLPILFEPPVASDRPGVERMLATLRTAPQLVHPDLELSYLPVAARLRETLDAGAIGQPRTAQIRLQAGWGHPPRHELSVVHMLAGWYLDLLDRVIGRTARRVLMLNGHDAPGLMQQRAIAHLDYGDMLGTFQINIGSVGPLRIDLEVNGDRRRHRLRPAGRILARAHAGVSSLASGPGTGLGTSRRVARRPRVPARVPRCRRTGHNQHRHARRNHPAARGRPGRRSVMRERYLGRRPLGLKPPAGALQSRPRLCSPPLRALSHATRASARAFLSKRAC